MGCKLSRVMLREDNGRPGGDAKRKPFLRLPMKSFSNAASAGAKSISRIPKSVFGYGSNMDYLTIRGEVLSYFEAQGFGDTHSAAG